MSIEALGASFLAPREVAVGSPVGQSLENVNTFGLADGCLCSVCSGDGYGLWRLNSRSTATADGVTIVQPIAGPGRWLKISESIQQGALGETLELWVDGDSGSDSNPGTQAQPFATIDQALRYSEGQVADVKIYLQPISDPEGYESELLFHPRNWKGNSVTIEGVGVVEVEPEFAIDADVSAVQYVDPGHYDVSTAGAGWTDDEFRGYLLEAVVSSIGIEGQRRLITRHTDAKMYLSAGHYNAADDGPSPGDTFRVVRQAVAIKLAPTVHSDDPFWVRSNSTLFGAQSGRAASWTVGSSDYSYLTQGKLNFRNLEFRVPDGYQTSRVLCVGSFDFSACAITKDSSNDFEFAVADGLVTAGAIEFAGPLYSVDRTGEGFASRDRGGDARTPRLTLENCMGHMGLAVGETTLRGTRFRPYGNWSIKAPTLTGEGALNVHDGSLFYGNSSRLGYWILDGGGEGSISIRDYGTFWVYNIPTHLGTGRWATAQNFGHLQLGFSDLNVEGSGAGVELRYNSTMRLLNNAYAGLGDVQVGQISATVRPAGAWAVGEFLIETPDDIEKCTAYRTA